jgi:hypothetical protein
MIHNPSYIYEEYDTVELIAADMRRLDQARRDKVRRKGYNIYIQEIYPVTFGLTEIYLLFDRGPVSAASDNHPPVDSAYYE